jgi:hypothetical protein
VRQLQEITRDLLQGKMDDLYNSIKYITNAKGNSDKFKIEIEGLKHIVHVLVEERLKFEKEFAMILDEF